MTIVEYSLKRVLKNEIFWQKKNMEQLRYNAALLALEPHRYVREAQRFAKEAQGYLLGEHSLPHVTLAQFYANPQTYAAIVDDLHNGGQIPQIQFNGFHFGKDDHVEGVWWVSLSIARDPALVHLHQFVCSILKRHQTEPLNSSADLYRPHLTLARVQKIHLDGLTSPVLAPSSFGFVVGESDEFGQFKKVLNQLRSAD